METLNQTIKYIKSVINKYRAPKLNVTKLKEYRKYAESQFNVYRNTRVGGYDILQEGYVFIAHSITLKDAKGICDEYRRECIMEQLDITKRY